jgi:hypothetical protein
MRGRRRDPIAATTQRPGLRTARRRSASSRSAGWLAVPESARAHRKREREQPRRMERASRRSSWASRSCGCSKADLKAGEVWARSETRTGCLSEHRDRTTVVVPGHPRAEVWGMRLRIWPTAGRVDCIAADQEGQKFAGGALSSSAVEDQPESGGDVAQPGRVRTRGHEVAWLVDGFHQAAIQTRILEVSCWYYHSSVWFNIGAGPGRRKTAAIQG